MTIDIYPGLNSSTKREFLRSLYTDHTEVANAIKEAICEYFDFTVSDVEGQSRKRPIVLARHLICYFIKAKTDLALVDIGNIVGGRDHSTVIYAINTVDDMVEVDRKFARTVAEVQNHLNTIKNNKPKYENQLQNQN